MTGPDRGPDGKEAAPAIGAAFRVFARTWQVPELDCGPLEPGFRPVGDWFADDRFVAAMMARQQNGTPGLDDKGAAAYFITEYAGPLAIAAAVPFLSHGLVPDYAPDRCALALSLGGEGERPRVRLRFLATDFATDRSWPEPQGTGLRFMDHDALLAVLRSGLEAHLRPLITRLQRRTGLPAQAMWRLAGDALAARFLEAGQLFDREDEAKSEALALLKAQGSPFANPQLHFLEIVIRDDAPPRREIARRSFRARGGCCRYYTVPGGALCTSCVLTDPNERRHRIESRMRQQLGLPPAEEAPRSLQEHGAKRGGTT